MAWGLMERGRGLDGLGLGWVPGEGYAELPAGQLMHELRFEAGEGEGEGRVKEDDERMARRLQELEWRLDESVLKRKRAG